MGAIERNYGITTTDASGFFTFTVQDLPAGVYQWRVKGPQYLATAGSLTLGDAQVVSQEMSLQRTGDVDGSDYISVLDFNIMRSNFGRGIGEPAYDSRADLTGDQRVDIRDFNLIKATFSMSGDPPI